MKKLLSYLLKYKKIIKERLKNADKKNNRVYWECTETFKTVSKMTSTHLKIAQNGGINVFASSNERYPRISEEYIFQKDPDIIIKHAGRNATQEEMKIIYYELINRDDIRSTRACKNNRIHIISWNILSGFYSIIGDLYLSRWINPDLFSDLDPDSIYYDLLKNHLEKKFALPVYNKRLKDMK